MAKTFTPAARTRKTIEFEIPTKDGDKETYHFDPPKIAGAMMPVLDPGASASSDDEDEEESGGGGRVSMTQATWAWLRKGLPAEEYQRLIDRMHDEDDDLDVPDVAGVVRWLMGQVTGRPTGSRRG